MFTLTFETGNAAFDDDAFHPEIAAVLRRLADRIESLPNLGTAGEMVLRDSNGNSIGGAAWTP